jgi:excisionase family DNA binding protein
VYSSMVMGTPIRLVQSGAVNTEEAARSLGVSKSTLLRMLKSGRITEVSRDRNGWRIFTREDLDRIRRMLEVVQ